eukprot:TRINITY_DN24706_c0_g1_i1.p1 TRINITY_DN24706_c0_g1~~TRINITY_DN24706_c0_g1_i1.p1  ORF type:complete len:457 (+),score=78.26 TRINITY_DN24706_c0_g1_i1:81-1451(+)
MPGGGDIVRIKQIILSRFPPEWCTERGVLCKNCGHRCAKDQCGRIFRCPRCWWGAALTGFEHGVPLVQGASLWDTGAACSSCMDSFSTHGLRTKHKHHCRLCMKPFCDNCWGRARVRAPGYAGSLEPACDGCTDQHLSECVRVEVHHAAGQRDMGHAFYMALHLYLAALFRDGGAGPVVTVAEHPTADAEGLMVVVRGDNLRAAPTHFPPTRDSQWLGQLVGCISSRAKVEPRVPPPAVGGGEPVVARIAGAAAAAYAELLRAWLAYETGGTTTLLTDEKPLIRCGDCAEVVAYESMGGRQHCTYCGDDRPIGEAEPVDNHFELARSPWGEPSAPLIAKGPLHTPQRIALLLAQLQGTARAEDAQLWAPPHASPAQHAPQPPQVPRLQLNALLSPLPTPRPPFTDGASDARPPRPPSPYGGPAAQALPPPPQLLLNGYHGGLPGGQGPCLFSGPME